MKSSYLILIFFLIGCYSSKKLSNQNVAFIYKQDNVFSLAHQHRVFHQSSDSTSLFLRINKNELLFKNDGSGFKANLKISYKFFSSFESETITDSISFLLKDIPGDETKFIMHTFSFPLATGLNKLTELTLHDLNNNQKRRDFISIDKSTLFGQQNFVVEDINQNKIFENYVHVNSIFKIHYAHNPVKSIFVKYYKDDNEIAAPPFFNNYKKPFDYTPDSTFEVMQDQHIRLTQTGLYHFQVDSTMQEGKTIFVFQHSYPEIKQVVDLVYPLRYITTKKEFDDILSVSKPKLSVDKLWLEVGGNKDRARKLIKHYYGRVRNSNNFFTSNKEGWKTDRGIIYIVYGPPHAIYKNSFSETWIYGDESNMMSISFNFLKVKILKFTITIKIY